MKNAFYSMLNALFAPEIFTFFSWLFGYVEKRHDKKVEINFKICDKQIICDKQATNCTANNYNTHIVQYLEK